MSENNNMTWLKDILKEYNATIKDDHLVLTSGKILMGISICVYWMGR